MAHTILVYSTASCPHCIRLKQFLAENSIAYENYDVGIDQGKADEMVRKSGQLGVPVIEIDGRIIVGFDRPKIEQALGLS
ncbi:MAG TPA: glutaredoxin domain-containing protein [Candidatus Omnitrophota bacterium]|nr:glutathione S-transferase N-terminal domain-containing protein [Candidatus Omnitrophota bacterium]HNQ50459.1 glutaredoxin domain-containing protein [Candidatus Omnitrophota bacterium]HQO38653.1 glutaredoxin domain-containing protein [Candidatus Omnitrophota bacterium]HQQ05726.1 glutaredoxin domain-containing protein [Candidatus Omnitrophota bacterium]